MQLKIDSKFSPEQLRIMHKVIHDAETISRNAYGSYALDNLTINLQSLEIKANTRMRTTAGRATLHKTLKRGVIDMNKRLFDTSGQLTDFENTFKHELAHIYINIIDKKQCGHNARWRKFFKQLGGNGKRCHDMYTDHLKAKTTKYIYECQCPNLSRIHHLTTHRHNKIMNRQVKVRCRKCSQYLTYGNVKVRG